MQRTTTNRLLVAICLLLAATAWGENELVLAAGGAARAVIVAKPEAGKPARFAAEELKGYLDRVSGASFTIVDALPERGAAILVGDSSASRELGVSVRDLKRDGCILKRVGDTILVAGRDDPEFDLRAYAHGGRWKATGFPECATAFGVYAFLEKVAGVRWYFPGPDGEVVPERPRLTVGALDAREEPWAVYRGANRLGSRYKAERCDFRDYVDMGIGDREATYWGLRNRMSTVWIPLNHTPSYHRWPQRFGADHPDWFELKADGTRDNVRQGSGTGHLCMSNAEVLKEVVAEVGGYFSSRPATDFGLGAWSDVVANGNYFSLLPEDGMQGCRCDACQRRYSDQTRWSELVWDFVGQVGRAVEKDHPGKYLTCLSYPPYLDVPQTVKLPGNVLAGVATQGGGYARDDAVGRDQLARIRAWKAFTGNRVALWTYNCREVSAPNRLAGVPQLEARALGRFFGDVRDDVLGCFYEDDLTYGFQAHPNLYVYFRLMWDPQADVGALLNEYADTFYGPAGDDLLAMLDRAEQLWFERIWVPTREVPIAADRELWEDIYSPAERARFLAWMEAADRRAAGTPYGSRVALFRKRFLQPLLDKAAEYEAMREKMAKEPSVLTLYRFSVPPTIDGRLDERGWRPPKGPVELVANDLDSKTKVPAERTYVSLGWDDTTLYVRFTCQESRLDALKAGERPFDDFDLCTDDSVEVFLDPSAKRQGFYHLLVNAAGAVADRQVTGQRGDASWTSGATASTSRDPERSCWYVELAIPLAALGGPPKERTPGRYNGWYANFTRNRYAHGGPVQYSTWSPFVQGFNNQPDKLGVLIFSTYQMPAK